MENKFKCTGKCQRNLFHKSDCLLPPKLQILALNRKSWFYWFNSRLWCFYIDPIFWYHYLYKGDWLLWNHLYNYYIFLLQSVSFVNFYNLGKMNWEKVFKYFLPALFLSQITHGLITRNVFSINYFFTYFITLLPLQLSRFSLKNCYFCHPSTH